MSTSPDDIPEFAQVIIKAFLQKIRQAFDLLMLGTSLPVLLVPLLFALFAFSTPQTRRSIMFKKCVIDVVLGIAFSVYGIYIEVSYACRSPLWQLINNHLQGNIVMNIFGFTSYKTHVAILSCTVAILPWIIDLTLLLRLLAIYPPRTQALSTTVCVFAFPIAIKLARLISIALYINEYFSSKRYATSGEGIVAAIHGPFVKAEWFLELFDNA
jgi:hypothetical protein